MRHWLVAAWLILLGWLPGAAAVQASDGLATIPSLEGRVTDLTGTLQPAQKADLESALAALEHERGAQIAILLLPTTQPESIEAFSIRLAEAWKIGRKGVDDGVFIVVAKNDRRVRIEVGYGLEGAIPDAAAKRIIEEAITPRFKAGDFHGGLQAAASRLASLIAGESLPAPAQRMESFAPDGDVSVFMLFVLAIVARFIRSLFGLVGALAMAGLAGFLAYWIFSTWMAAAIAAVLVLFLSFARGGGGWHSGGGGGGFSGGSGGFSGGGGGFGGGGSSGSW